MSIQTETIADTARAEFAALVGAKDWARARGLTLRRLACAPTDEERFIWLNNLSVVEWGRGRHAEALVTLDEAAPFGEKVFDHFLLGNHHNNRALPLRALGRLRESADEYGMAAVHYEIAGRRDRQAIVLNNLAVLMIEGHRADEAAVKADEARKILAGIGLYQLAAEAARTLAEAYAILAAAEAKRFSSPRPCQAATGGSPGTQAGGPGSGAWAAGFEIETWPPRG